MTTAVAIPETATELEEILNDSGRLQAIFKQDGGIKGFIKNYASAAMAKDTDMAAQIKEQVQMGLADFIKDQKEAGFAPIDLGNGVDAGTIRNASRAAGQNPKAAGAVLNGVFPDLATFMQNIWHKGNPNAEVQERLDKLRNYSEQVPDAGGFLVPEEYRSQLLMLSLENAVVRPRATVIPMTAPRLNFPCVDSTSNVSSVYGGIVVYRTEEGAELVESAATFGSIKLDATKQTALAHVTNELIKDNGAFEAFLNATFPPAMAFYEDLDFLSGNGVGGPLGALASDNPAIIAVPGLASGANTIVWEHVITMYSRMLPSSINNAVWVASPDTFVQLATMALSVGTGGSAVWLTDAHGAPVLTLLGRPVIMSEKAPSILGTQGDLSFVDFSMYLIGDRQTMTVDSSPHVKFTSDKTTYRVIARNDGRPWLQSAITPHNGGPTLSPFVQISSTRT